MKRKIIISLILSVVLIGTYCFGNISSFNNVASAAESQEMNTIAVNGMGTIKVQPDVAYIYIGVQTENKDSKAAQKENAATMEKVMKAVTDLGIKKEDIQTREYSNYPDYRYDQSTKKSIINGYVVRNTMEITIHDLTLVGKVIGETSENGANITNSIRFAVSDSEKYYLQALEKAVENADNKANAIAKSIQVSISKPYKVTENSNGGGVIYNERMMDRGMAMKAAAADDVSIESGELEVSAYVNVEYKY